MNKIIILLLLFPVFALASDQCISQKTHRYIISGMRIGEAIYTAQDECRGVIEEEQIVVDGHLQFNFQACLDQKHRELIWHGKNPQDAYMQAADFCKRADPDYQYDPRPTTTNLLYTLFMTVGVYRDQAVLRAYEIVYSPGGKGPKTQEEVNAKIKADINSGHNFHQAVWRIYFSK